VTSKRKKYRAAKTPATQLEVALLGAGNTLHPASIVDASGGGMRLMLANNHPQDIGLGTVYQLRLKSKALPSTIDTPAMIVHAQREESGLLLGMRFLDWMGLKALVPASITALFNMRQEPRLALDPSSPIAVMVRGVGDSFEQRGVVLDLSCSGMSFSTSRLAQRTLGRSDECSVEFTPPGLERRFRFAATIRDRSWQGESLRYGVWFDRDFTEGFVALQQELGQYVEARLASAMRDLVAK